MLSSCVGPDVGGLILEEKVEQEVPRGPQGISFEELNPDLSKASPDACSVCRSNMSCLILFHLHVMLCALRVGSG
jgi:hypothetical protein